MAVLVAAGATGLVLVAGGGDHEVVLPEPDAVALLPSVPRPAAGDAGPLPVRWAVDLDTPAGDVVLAEDMVVAAGGAELRAYDLADGQEAWRSSRSDGQATELHLAGDRVVALWGDDGVEALDVATGTRRWASDRSASVGLVGDEVIVVTDGEHARALSLGDGEVIWTRELAATVASGTASGTMAVATQAGLVGLDASTGEVRWHLPRVREVRRPDQGARLVVATDRESLFIVDVVSGTLQARVVIAERLGERLRGVPRAVARDRVLVSMGDGLVALDSSGRPIWRTTAEAHTSLLDHPDPALAVVGGVNLRGIDPGTGREVLRLTPTGWFTAMDLDDEAVVVSMHTPSRGRLVLHDRR